MRYLSLLTFAAMAVIAAPTISHAAEPRISREAIEWCSIWIPDANESKLPRVLLIGDSITGGYGPKVADALKGKASVARLTITSSAELSADARAFSERMAASGLFPPASVGWPLAWPGRCRPRSTSQTASRQFSLRHIWAISTSASGCSCD